MEENNSNVATQESMKKAPVLTKCKACVIAIAFLVVCLAASTFAIGVLWTRLTYGGGTANIAGQPQAEQKDPLEVAYDNLIMIQDDDHVRGDQNAKYTLIEYSDFECPYCQSFHPTAQQALEENTALNWVYRHFPLDSIHPLAVHMAVASECVAEQLGNDGFWSFADAVAVQKPDSEDAVRAISVNLGVNGINYDECITSGKYSDTVFNERTEGFNAGVEGTPGNFLVNNETGEIAIVPGAVPYVQFKQILDSIK